MNSAAHARSPLPLFPPPASRQRPILATDMPTLRVKPGLGQSSQVQRVGVAALVMFAHLAGLAALVQFATRPVVIPELTSISLALIPAEPAIEPVAPAPIASSQPPAPSEPKVERVQPPQPQPKKPAPPPKPQPKLKPLPAPKLTASPTALRQTEPAAAPETVVEPSQSVPVAAVAAPAASIAAAPAAVALTAARFDAAYLNNPSPAYPMLSRRLREEGQVMLRVLVSADGQPMRIELRTGSGSDRLDRAAEDAVARWRFVPARRGDTAVEAWVLVPIVFKLKGN